MSEYIRIGKVSINKDAIPKMSFEEFKENYGKYIRRDLEKAFIENGGKMPNAKTVKKDA